MSNRMKKKSNASRPIDHKYDRLKMGSLASKGQGMATAGLALKKERQSYDNLGLSKQERSQIEDFKRNLPKNRSGWDVPVDSSKRTRNDPAWYMISENIGKSAASIPFNVFTGTEEQLDVDGYNNYTYWTKSTPGVMVLNYASIPGTSSNATSAVNVASRAVYSWVRHQNSGSKNYESPDYMMYILAMQQVYNLISEAERLYRLARTYSGLNRYVPDLLISALGFDPQSIRDNLAQFRYGINIRITKASSLFIPKEFKIFERQSLLSQLVLCDSSSVRGQFYTYKLAGYFKFDATTYETGTALKYVERASKIMTWEDILAEIDDCLDVLLANEDANVMSGDTLKAYGRENCYTLQELDEDSVQDFVYDEDLLNQIENAYCVGPQLLPDVTQQSGYILFEPKTTLQSSAYRQLAWFAAKNRYFNSHKDEPDWKDVLEWSRFSAAINKTNIATGDTVVWEASSEIVLSFNVFEYDYSSGEPKVRNTGFTNVVLIEAYSDSSLWPLQTQLPALISKFDWHPVVYWYMRTSSSNNYVFGGAMYDAKVYTLVSGSTVARLNELATMGLFMTKGIGTHT